MLVHGAVNALVLALGILALDLAIRVIQYPTWRFPAASMDILETGFSGQPAKFRGLARFGCDPA